jgi:hypothetical protein
MRIRVVALVAIAAAVTLVSIAAARPEAKTQPVAIELSIIPERTFVLNVQHTGSLKGDTGSITTVDKVLRETPRIVMRDGQRISIYSGVWTLAGKRGTVTIRERNEWVDVGRGHGVAVGTWKFVRGTGQYAGLGGGGRSGHAGLGSPWYARYEGVLTSP